VSLDRIKADLRVANFFAGWNSIGVAINPQPNNGEATGAFYSTISAYARNQSRAHASNAYYRPIAGVRRNLHLITGHTVSKINFSKGVRAVSVDVSSALPCPVDRILLTMTRSCREPRMKPVH
jgi:choline dehydrogenase-like flavoprotein